MANCKECNTPIDEARFRSEFCDDACRMRYTRRKEKALKAESEIKANNLHDNPHDNPNHTLEIYPNKPNINSNNNPNNPMANENETTNEFLLKGRILELQTMNAELKAQFQADSRELKAEKKELEKEIKTVTRLHNDLVVNINTLESKHEQELSGFEQNKKSLGKELIDLIRDKDVMGNVINAVSMLKGGDKSDQASLEGAESEDLQAVKCFFNAFDDEHQKMVVNSLYIYSKRRDLLEQQAKELEVIINGAVK